MRVECVGNACGQISCVRGRAQPRHVKIRLFQIAVDLGEQLLNQLLAARVMNEFGLQFRQNRGVPVHRQMVLRVARVQRRERLLGHVRGELAERQGTRRGVENDQLAVVQHFAPRFVRNLGFEEYSVHCSPSFLWGTSSPCRASSAATSEIIGNLSLDRSAISSNEWLPSDKLSTQSIASSRCSASGYPPSSRYNPRRPSCGSQRGLTFTYVISFSRSSKSSRHSRRLPSSASALTHSRLSADVWYSAKHPCGVRFRQPTGRLNPGEQYCLSSYP